MKYTLLLLSVIIGLSAKAQTIDSNVLAKMYAKRRVSFNEMNIQHSKMIAAKNEYDRYSTRNPTNAGIVEKSLEVTFRLSDYRYWRGRYDMANDMIFAYTGTYPTEPLTIKNHLK